MIDGQSVISIQIFQTQWNGIQITQNIKLSLEMENMISKISENILENKGAANS